MSKTHTTHPSVSLPAGGTTPRLAGLGLQKGATGTASHFVASQSPVRRPRPTPSTGISFRGLATPEYTTSKRKNVERSVRESRLHWASVTATSPTRNMLLFPPAPSPIAALGPVNSFYAQQQSRVSQDKHGAMVQHGPPPLPRQQQQHQRQEQQEGRLNKQRLPPSKARRKGGKKRTKARRTANKEGMVKGPWTGEEDTILRRLVHQNGPRNWKFIANYLPGRIAKQCRERWCHHLCPGIKKGMWTDEEDRVCRFLLLLCVFLSACLSLFPSLLLSLLLSVSLFLSLSLSRSLSPLLGY